MISESEVERFVKEPGLLVELCREVVKGLGVGTERHETAAMEIQLREIARTIEKLDKQGVSVPEAFRAEKTRLAAALGTHAEADQVFSGLADGLEDVLQDIRAHIGRTSQLRKANTAYVDRSRSESSKTGQHVFRQLIIDALQHLGGSAHKRDIYKEIERKYANHFLPGDLEYLPDGKRISWENRCDWVGMTLQKDGLLKKMDSPRGFWKLSEGHQ
ncbi:winged helix-turn-helix domain-containing protein [Desulfonatronum thioautotrophicum]|uniref:winged helix-turn-helix domain-containing protein n=1 Tax=Desulfonatronum thioautotrophicum TaxID=617001 RepID=UPI0005EB888C|nr:winged helix-turn-helix domain-containing protein [Desulfonatronum thioautotrophicum]